VRKRPLTLFGECGQSAVVSHRRVASASGPIMAAIQDIVAINPKSARAANPLCFLMDEDFVFRQSLAKELRRDGVDVVEFSNSHGCWTWSRTRILILFSSI
jgi:hypothetical protein